MENFEMQDPALVVELPPSFAFLILLLEWRPAMHFVLHQWSGRRVGRFSEAGKHNLYPFCHSDHTDFGHHNAAWF